jgi:hypothetical protein
MKTATFELKCRRCGKVFDGPSTGEDYALPFIIELLGSQKDNLYKTGGVLSKTSIHQCDKDGNGVGDLIGYRLHEDN